MWNSKKYQIPGQILTPIVCVQVGGLFVHRFINVRAMLHTPCRAYIIYTYFYIHTISVLYAFLAMSPWKVGWKMFWLGVPYRDGSQRLWQQHFLTASISYFQFCMCNIYVCHAGERCMLLLLLLLLLLLIKMQRSNSNTSLFSYFLLFQPGRKGIAGISSIWIGGGWRIWEEGVEMGQMGRISRREAKAWVIGLLKLWQLMPSQARVARVVF